MISEMDFRLRTEQSDDYRIVEELTREAFWGTQHSACDEHLLVHKLRKHPSFIPELDFVVESNGKIVGNIMYSLAKVVADDGTVTEVLNMGPLSVLPGFQQQGIGTALMVHTIGEARQLEYKGIVFYGHPDYYPRFGFRRAKKFGICTSGGTTVDALMAMPLFDEAFSDVKGRFIEDSVFDIDAKEAEDFDKGFPPKTVRIHETIEILRGRLPDNAMSALKKHGIELLAHLNRFSGREIASWHGMTEEAFPLINALLREHGYAKKVWS